MTTLLPDPIERGFDAAERWADAHSRGDEFLCGHCEQWAPESSMQFLSPNPEAAPVCIPCADAALPERHNPLNPGQPHHGH